MICDSLMTSKSLVLRMTSLSCITVKLIDAHIAPITYLFRNACFLERWRWLRVTIHAAWQFREFLDIKHPPYPLDVIEQTIVLNPGKQQKIDLAGMNSSS
jgi:hypothetical protein